MKQFPILLFCLVSACLLAGNICLNAGEAVPDTDTDDAKTEKRESGYFTFENTSVWPVYPQISWYSKFWPDPKVDTNVFITFGGGYNDAYYYRNPDQSIIPVTDPDYIDKTTFRHISLNSGIGVSHGLMYNPDIRMNTLEVFCLYRIMYRYNFEDQSPAASLIYDSSIPDREQILLSTFVTGFFLNNWTLDESTNTRNGWFGQLTYEYAPLFLNPAGGADFMRVSFLISNFLPLINNKIFSLYLSQRMAIDIIFGDAVPNIASASFGGRVISQGYDGIPGLGGVVRGIDAVRYDGLMKAFYNLDLRANFPSLISGYFMPGFILTADLGYYDNMEYILTDRNIIFTTGGGLSLHVDSRILIDLPLATDLNVLVLYNFYESSVEWYIGGAYYY